MNFIKSIIFVYFILITKFAFSESLPKHPDFIDINNYLLEYGCNENIYGHPIGGGKGYANIINSWDYYVKNIDELLDALEIAKKGEIIYISDTAKIDVTGYQDIIIPEQVTLASGRGNDESEGALIYTHQLRTYPLFVAEQKSRITGLRLQGPDSTRRTAQMTLLRLAGKYYSILNSRAVQTTENEVEIDNCELYGWTHAAIYFMPGARNGYVHNNFIHQNQRSGLGYGILVDSSSAIVESNLFDWNRHHISGEGKKTTNYEAYNNLILEHANGHSFDMHGGKDRGDNTDIAGDIILIYNNTFLASHVYAIMIRGIPQVECNIYNNFFSHDNDIKAIIQINDYGNLTTQNNSFSK